MRQCSSTVACMNAVTPTKVLECIILIYFPRHRHAKHHDVPEAEL
jgi:hypothetical protein